MVGPGAVHSQAEVDRIRASLEVSTVAASLEDSTGPATLEGSIDRVNPGVELVVHSRQVEADPCP